MLSKKKPDVKHIVWFYLYKVKELPLGVASERGIRVTSGMLVMFCFLIWLLVPWMCSAFEKVIKLLWHMYLSVPMSYLSRDLKMHVRLEFHFEISAYVFKCTESVYLPKCSSKTDSQGRCTTFILWFFITCGLPFRACYPGWDQEKPWSSRWSLNVRIRNAAGWARDFEGFLLSSLKPYDRDDRLCSPGVRFTLCIENILASDRRDGSGYWYQLSSSLSQASPSFSDELWQIIITFGHNWQERDEGRF